MGITTDTISEYKSNLSHTSDYSGLGTRHIFVKTMKINTPYLYLYDNFISPSELSTILSTEVIPHNHKVFITYITEDRVDVNHPIGNQFVVMNTILTCNKLLGTICRRANTWLNATYNHNCIIGPMTEHIVSRLLVNDKTIPERHLDTYYEEFIIAKTILDMLSDFAEDAPLSVSRILDIFDKRLTIEIPQTMRYGDSGILKPAVFNTIMNLDKVQYRLSTLDYLLDVKFDTRLMKAYFLNNIPSDNM